MISEAMMGDLCLMASRVANWLDQSTLEAQSSTVEVVIFYLSDTGEDCYMMSHFAVT